MLEYDDPKTVAKIADLLIERASRESRSLGDLKPAKLHFMLLIEGGGPFVECPSVRVWLQRYGLRDRQRGKI